MNCYAPVDIERRSDYWRSTGWTGHDASSDGWSGADESRSVELQQLTLTILTYTPAFRASTSRRPTATGGRDYIWYDPAYRYGDDLAHDERYADYDTWTTSRFRPRAAGRRQSMPPIAPGTTLRDAIRNGWEEVKDAFDFDSDFDLFDDSFREHYRTHSNRGHDYDYYVPGYRYGLFPWRWMIAGTITTRDEIEMDGAASGRHGR